MADDTPAHIVSDIVSGAVPVIVTPTEPSIGA
jgi:hypothetical protein